MHLVVHWADGSAVESVLIYALVSITLGAVFVLAAFTITRFGRVQKRLDELSGEKDRYMYENDALRRRLYTLVGADHPAPAGAESCTSKSSSVLAPPHVAVLFNPTNAPLMPGMRPDALQLSMRSRDRCRGLSRGCGRDRSPASV